LSQQQQQKADDGSEGNNDNSNNVMTSSSIIDSSAFTNYNELREDGQRFFLWESINSFESTDSIVSTGVGLEWWCDLEFLSSDHGNYGYVGRGVEYYLGSTIEDNIAQGGSSPLLNRAESTSAIYVPSLGIFEGQVHPTHDDWVL
jgi:hypothetical protein